MNPRPLPRPADTRELYATRQRDFDTRMLASELADRMAASGFEPMRLMDEGAERLLLAAMADDYWPREKVEPLDFYFRLHRDVAKVLDNARARHIVLTIQTLARGVEALSADGSHLEIAIEDLIFKTPTVVHVDELAHRVRILAWRRKMVAAASRLRALLVEPEIEDHAIDAAIDALVAMRAARPNLARSE